MPIDPSIPLQVQPMKLESPVNQLAMYGEAMKIGEMNRGIEEQNKLNEYLRSGADLTKPKARAELIKYGKTGLAYGKALAEQEKTGLETKKLGMDVTAKDLEIQREKLGNLAFNPSNENVQAHLQDSVLQGKLTPQAAAQQWQQVANLNPVQRKQYFTEMGVKTEERYKMAEQQRHNKATEGIQALAYDPTRQGQIAEAKALGTGRAEMSPLSAKGQVIAKGKNLVNDVATDMAASYGVLKDLGGIKSKENSPQQNISAALQSSMVGQIGGSMMGTPEQDARDAIMSQRPILVQAIVKATGMSSQQINSNQELKNMLDAATDPSKGYETNIKTLNKINQRFGLGGDIIPLPSTTAKDKVSVGATPKANPTIDALLEKYK